MKLLKTKASPTSNEISLFLAALPAPQRAALQRLRKIVLAIVHESVETISYGIPTIKYMNKGVAGFAAYKEHCSYFPFSGRVVEELKTELKSFSTSKGTIRFTIEKPLSVALVKKLVKARMAQIESSKKSVGARRDVPL